MSQWDKDTLYKDSPFFGVGMSGWRKADLFESREDYFEDTFCHNLYYLEVTEFPADMDF